MRRKAPWQGRWMLFGSVLSICVLAFGLVWGVRTLTSLGVSHPASSATRDAASQNQQGVAPSSQIPSGVPGGSSAPFAGTGPIHLVALGDSLTRGTGDDTGRGYVGDVQQTLASMTGRKVLVNNLGVNGQESPQLLAELAQPEVKRLIQNADLITLTIGANDLRAHVNPADVSLAQISGIQKQFSQHLADILGQLRSLNTHAPIVMLGLYNPFLDFPEAAAATSEAIRDWNAAEMTVTSRFTGTIVVPTFDLFERYPDHYLFMDHFHPNTQGYARIAVRIVQDLS